MIYYPTADPRVPVPSIIPVTVEVALSFPLSASYFPRSAAHAEDIKLFSPLIKNPRKNIRMNSTGIGRSRMKNFRLKLINEANITAASATGERFPYIRSER
jgi:hypothetical protein